MPVRLPPRPSMRLFARLGADARAAAIVETALVLPLFIVLLYGIMGYGQYFLLAHSVQQLANDAARASMAGLDEAERRTIAGQTVTREAQALGAMETRRVVTSTSETASHIVVRVRYDASNVPLFRTPILPMPDPVIERSAVIRPGDLS